MRKIVQIASDNNGDDNWGIYALCDDGTLWSGSWVKGELEWKQIETPFTKDGQNKN